MDLGLQFAVAIAIGFFGGYYIDGKIGTLPVFVIIGLIIGSVAGFLNIYRAVYSDKDKNKSSNESKT